MTRDRVDNAVSADELARRGVALHQRGELAGAEKLYRDALGVSPKHPDATHFLGLCLAGQGRLEEAVNMIREAIAFSPQQPHYHANLADILRQLGHADEAEQSYRRALALDADDVGALRGLGELLTGNDDFRQALELLGRAAELQPNDAVIATAKATTLARAGRSREALTLLDSILRTAPKLAQAHHSRAVALADLGRIGESEAAAFDATSCDSNLAAALWQIGLCRFDAGDFDGAVAALRRAVDAAPQLGIARACLGVALQETGAAAAGRAEFREASRLRSGLSAVEEAVEYAKESGKRGGASPPRAFGFKASQICHALDTADGSGLILELGVYTGRSLRLIADHIGPARTVHGFDSFEGLPENWIAGVDRGAYDAGRALPEVPANAALHPGWFEDSLPRFAATHSGALSFANIDCDIYSSTRTFFDCFGERVRIGTVLVFDEYFGYPGWRDHEFKAFHEFIDRAHLAYEYLALSPITGQATVRIIA